MTATQVFASYTVAGSATGVSRRARPRGIDRLVMRLSLAMLLDAFLATRARHRADWGSLSREEQILRHANALAVERDQRDAAARIARVF